MAAKTKTTTTATAPKRLKVALTNTYAKIIEAVSNEAAAGKKASDTYAAVGAIIDVNVPCLPLLSGHQKATYAAFKEKNGTEWSVSDWTDAMSYINGLRAEHTANGPATVEFKTILLEVKRSCMHWQGAKKRESAIKRAVKENLPNPKGKVKPKRVSTGAATTRKPTITIKQFDTELGTVIKTLNALKDKNREGATGHFNKHLTKLNDLLSKVESCRKSFKPRTTK
jgi:hypothetical protein